MDPSEAEARERFPNMTPMTGNPPAMFRLNGCGAALYGRRDKDPQTGTYVSTYCVSILFFPILALKAYRIADAPSGGYYFIGKEPISGFARTWNIFVLLMGAFLAASLALGAYYSSPEAVARRRLEAARAAPTGEALILAVEAAEAQLAFSGPALEIIRERVGAATPSELLPFLEAAERLEPELIDARERLTLARACLARDGASSDPRALELLDHVAPLMDSREEYLTAARALGEARLAEDPSSPERASDLARICEELGDIERIVAVLEPVRGALTTQEGARILGQVDIGRGEVERGAALLNAYVSDRVTRLTEAQARFDEAVEAFQKAEFSRLRAGVGPDALFQSMEAAKDDEERQRSLLMEHMRAAMARSPEVRTGLEARDEALGVIPVALDAAALNLQRARSKSEASARRDIIAVAAGWLDAVEVYATQDPELASRLLLLRGQLSLALGDAEAGEAAFDGFLAMQQRSAPALLAVAQLSQEAGDLPRAHALAKEAYGQGDHPLAPQAAVLASLTAAELDEEAEWLERSGVPDPSLAARLAQLKAYQALQRGERGAAEAQLKAAIERLAALPRSASSLNNLAVATLGLYDLTHDLGDLASAGRILERAAELEGADPVLEVNRARVDLQLGIAEVVGDALRLEQLDMAAGLETLRLLYQDAASRRAVVAKMLANPRVQSARARFTTCIQQPAAPLEAIEAAVNLTAFLRDAEALEALQQTLASRRLPARPEPAPKPLDAAGRRALEAALAEGQAVLDWAEAEGRPAEKAAARLRLASGMIGAWSQGGEVEPARAASLAEAAVALQDSALARAVRRSARLLVALEVAAEADPQVAELCAERRELGPIVLATLVLERPRPGKAAMLESPAFAAVLEGLRAEDAAFPDSPGLVSWLLLERAGAEVEATRAALAESPRIAREVALGELVHPAGSSAAFDAIWLALARGDAAAAKAAYDRFSQRGARLPALSWFREGR